MFRKDNVSLASLTTFKIGGNARTVFDCSSVEEIQTALAYAREGGLPWYVLGSGSNVLASDAGYDGVIILPRIGGISFENREGKEDNADVGEVLVTAGAGVSWDALVEETVVRGLWGLENLAGIPGTVGAAPVQNVGAYGADISGTLAYVDVLDTTATEPALTAIRMTNVQCEFGYRDSIFKKSIDIFQGKFIILRAAFLLTKQGTPQIAYPDLAALADSSTQAAPLTTPQSIAQSVRAIRAQKFPDLSTTGTAGSFFKNSIVTVTEYSNLKNVYPDLPGYPETDPLYIKVSLAWILDKVLNLRGFSNGSATVRLFERQPLVLVAEPGATAADVDALANEVAHRVFTATSIRIEREVRSLSSLSDSSYPI
jgi:UDP-N-acetylmuramate dehydrogenase